MQLSFESRVAALFMFACVLFLGIACALLFDFASPNMRQVNVASSVSILMPADDVASQMEAQINAGAPGVALALEQIALPETRRSVRVMAARAHALFELGNAPAALEVIRQAQDICAHSRGCSYGEHSILLRFEIVFNAVVSAGVVDPKYESSRTAQAFQAMMRRAVFTQIQSY